MHRAELESFSRPQPCSTPRLQAELVVTEPQTRHRVLAMKVCFSNVPFQNSLTGEAQQSMLVLVNYVLECISRRNAWK